MIAVAAAVALSVALTPADRFLDELRCALARGDRTAVARMFEYPAMIVARGARVPVQDVSTLIKVYDLAFPPELQGVIAMARVKRDAKTPHPYGVVVDGSSLMIGNAWLWARRVGAQYRIARIILPDAWVTIGSGAVTPPQRIELQRRQASTLLSGALNPYEMQSYIVARSKDRSSRSAY